MTLAERTEREVFFLGEFGGRAGKNGFAGAQVEAMWVTDVLNAVRKKARKKFTTNNVILVVYPNGDYPALHEDEAVALLYEFSEHSSNVEEFRVFARVDVLLREPARIASVSR